LLKRCIPQLSPKHQESTSLPSLFMSNGKRCSNLLGVFHCFFLELSKLNIGYCVLFCSLSCQNEKTH
jgi:hypothetical protein